MTTRAALDSPAVEPGSGRSFRYTATCGQLRTSATWLSHGQPRKTATVVDATRATARKAIVAASTDRTTTTGASSAVTRPKPHRTCASKRIAIAQTSAATTPARKSASRSSSNWGS